MKVHETYRAVVAAYRDHLAGRGGYFCGPATPVYLRVRAALATHHTTRGIR